MGQEDREGHRADSNVTRLLPFFGITTLAGFAASLLLRHKKGENVDDALTEVCDELTKHGRGFHFTRCEPFGSIVRVSFGKVELNAPSELVVATALFAVALVVYALVVRRGGRAPAPA